MGDSPGTVAPGKPADLILVDGDPLAEIAVVGDPRRVTFVMKGGVAYKVPGPRGGRTGEAMNRCASGASR